MAEEQDQERDAKMDELQATAAEIQQHAERVQAIQAEGGLDPETLAAEIGGTMFPLFADWSRQSLDLLIDEREFSNQLSERVWELEDELAAGSDTSDSQLLPEDAADLVEVLHSYEEVLRGTLAMLPENAPADAAKATEEMLARVTGWVERIADMTLEPSDDDDTEDDGDEPEAAKSAPVNGAKKQPETQ